MKFKILLNPFILLLLLACNEENKSYMSSIAITWEIISNTHKDLPASKAAFTLYNNSQRLLDGNNWELYFNQSPRNIINSNYDSISQVHVEHINGDWYRIKPKKDFLLRSGEHITIFYETSHWLIKESDTPIGLYFVNTDEKGNKTITEVEDYTIKPFERPEQISRHKNDFLSQPTPQKAFEMNRGLCLLPEKEILKIIPSPKYIKVENNKVVFSKELIIFYDDDEILSEATVLKKQLNNLLGWNIQIRKGSAIMVNSVQLSKDNAVEVSHEAYRLRIKEDKTIHIEGDKTGIFYGIQSLIALLPIQSIIEKGESIELPLIAIDDSPRFAYRGVHVDVARNFHPKETIIKVLDILAFYKINTLHIHLTDDEGWRIEIPNLPELTKVGGQRGHTTKDSPSLHPSYGSGPTPYTKNKQGSGYFTREEYIEILQYAKKMHIKVIPEINLPGHARAAIKAMEARYLHYMQKGDADAANEFRLIDPEDKSVYLSAQHYNDNIVNVARESVYNFLEAVVDAMVDMYSEAQTPLDIIHIGGDEVPNGAWTQSPMVDALMTDYPEIKHHENMHVYFTERALEILNNKGIKMAGWEEIALHTHNSNVPNPKFADGRVIPYAWNSLWGKQDLAYRLANMGYPVVMCHVSNFYFDLAYSNHPKEPGLYWGGFVNTRNAWHYNPFELFKSTLIDNMGRPINIDIEYKDMERLKPDAKRNILGLQAQLWGEAIRGQEMLEYQLLPKLIGFSESTWAPKRRWESTTDATDRAMQVDDDWNIFANTLAQRELPRLSYLFGGYNYRVPPPGASISDGLLHANLEFPGLQIRYTVDGNEPTLSSSLYEKPLEIKGNCIKIKAFDRSGKSSRTIVLKNSQNEN
jgi:hexosaminidase